MQRVARRRSSWLVMNAGKKNRNVVKENERWRCWLGEEGVGNAEDRYILWIHKLVTEAATTHLSTYMPGLGINNDGRVSSTWRGTNLGRVKGVIEACLMGYSKDRTWTAAVQRYNCDTLCYQS